MRVHQSTAAQYREDGGTKVNNSIDTYINTDQQRLHLMCQLCSRVTLNVMAKNFLKHFQAPTPSFCSFYDA